MPVKDNFTSPSYYFDLSRYEHAAIFEGCAHVWEALGKISSYLERLKLGKIHVTIPTGVYLINPEQVFIGEGSVVEPGAYIQGPCYIGKNCSVRHGAYIRGNLITGNDCVIGHDTEMKNAILLNDAKAGHFAYVGDTILGNGTNLGAGTACANFKLDGSSVVVHLDGKTYNTGMRKFGAIVGDRSQIGCNCVLNPGSLLGKEVQSYPCTNFGGFTPNNHLVRLESRAIKKTKGIS
jgi:NDP-sugar pyrophosphorylase family protein